jgi:hypothetical protein
MSDEAFPDSLANKSLRHFADDEHVIANHAIGCRHHMSLGSVSLLALESIAHQKTVEGYPVLQEPLYGQPRCCRKPLFLHQNFKVPSDPF